MTTLHMWSINWDIFSGKQCGNMFFKTKKLVFLPFDPTSPLLGSPPKGKGRNVDKHLQRARVILARLRNYSRLQNYRMQLGLSL